MKAAVVLVVALSLVSLAISSRSSWGVQEVRIPSDFRGSVYAAVRGDQDRYNQIIGAIKYIVYGISSSHPSTALANPYGVTAS